MRLKILLSGLIILTLLVSISAQKAQAQAGNYIVADPGAAALFIVPPPAGPPAPIFVGAPFSGPGGVAIDALGNYIVADAFAAALFIVPPPAGPPVFIWSGAPFVSPRAVAIVPGAPPPTPTPTPTPRPVGGTVLPVSKLAILSPYLALFGLVGAATAAFAVKRRRKA